MPRSVAAAAFAVALWAGMGTAAVAQPVVAHVQVHGNTLTPDADIVRIAQLDAGAAFTDELLTAAADRLRATNRFAQVDVLKRYASIDDPSQVLIVILVDEGPVRIALPAPGQPRVMRGSTSNLMFLPVLEAEDGYGVTYGARVAVNEVAGAESRLLVPLTWGGDKRAAVEFQKDLSSPWTPRVRAGAFVQRRTHPYFQENADRKRVWGRAEWPLATSLRAGSTVTWQAVSFLAGHDTTRSAGVDIVLDTRIDTTLPRNALYARASAERLRLVSQSLTRTELESRGYLGIYRQSVLVLRVVRENMNGPAPPYFKSILGGENNLRGFRAGTAVGDTLVAGSLELRIPLSSPLTLARLGISVFADTGAAYNHDERLADRRWKTGAGGGIWLTTPLFRLTLTAAHGVGAGTRVHVGGGFVF